MGYIYIFTFYSVIKKNKILPFSTTWMDFEGPMLSAISDRRKTNTIISLICGIEENKTNKIRKMRLQYF